MPEDLPVGVVDLDNSSLSRNITRQIDATQLGRTLKFESYRAQRKPPQTGEINAFCVFPDRMYECDFRKTAADGHTLCNSFISSEGTGQKTF